MDRSAEDFSRPCPRGCWQRFPATRGPAMALASKRSCVTFPARPPCGRSGIPAAGCRCESFQHARQAEKAAAIFTPIAQNELGRHRLALGRVCPRNRDNDVMVGLRRCLAAVIAGFMATSCTATTSAGPGVPPVSDAARAAGFVDVRTAVPDAVIDLRYATTNNFTHTQLYPSDARCLVHQSMAPGLGGRRDGAAPAGPRAGVLGLLPAARRSGQDVQRGPQPGLGGAPGSVCAQPRVRAFGRRDIHQRRNNSARPNGR